MTRKSTPYDEDGTCPYCGGSLYESDGRLACEDCGETTSMAPDPDYLLELKREREYLNKIDPLPEDLG